MAFTTVWGVNLQKDSGLAADKQWKAVIFRLPSTAASGATAPSDTTGPLGATGTASATYTHGDGTATGYASPVDAFQRALVYIENDRKLNGDS